MKALSIIVVGTFTALNLPGQGLVNFANSSSTAVTNACTGQRVVTGTLFKVSLFLLPATGQMGEPAPTVGDFDHSGILVSTAGFAGPGIFAPGVRTAPTPLSGGWGWFQVRAWETSFGSNYDQARDNPVPQNGRLALVGTSNIFRVDTGEPMGDPFPVPAGLVENGLQSFYVGENICPIPEPASIGLWLLGLIVLGWRGRSTARSG